MKVLPIVVAGLGLVLLVLSFLAGILFPTERLWTPEKSQQMRQVSNSVRDLSLKLIEAETNPGILKGENHEKLKQERTLLEEKQAKMQAEFATANNSSNKMANWLRWSGILAAIGGFAAHRAVNGE